jgi:hypothetical protein
LLAASKLVPLRNVIPATSKTRPGTARKKGAEGMNVMKMVAGFLAVITPVRSAAKIFVEIHL